MANYTKADMDAVSNNPELTDEQLHDMVPFTEAFPKLAATMRVRGPQKTARKVSTTIRLSPEVIDHFRSSGPGWQSRIDEALKDWVAQH